MNDEKRPKHYRDKLKFVDKFKKNNVQLVFYVNYNILCQRNVLFVLNKQAVIGIIVQNRKMH